MLTLPNDKKDGDNRGSQSAISLGYQMMAAMLVFVGGGYYLDSKRGGGHLYTLIGVALAFLYSGYEVWKLVTLMNQEEERKKAAKKSNQNAA